MIINLNFAANSLTTGLQLAETVKNSSLLVNVMLFALIAASVVSLAIIAAKFVQYRLATIETAKFVEVFWKNNVVIRAEFLLHKITDFIGFFSRIC